MQNRYIITTSLIKNKGYTQGNVSDDVITTSLRRVQDGSLEPILGTTFFKRLLDGVEAGDLNADETALIDNYIAAYLVARVDYKIVPHLAFEIRSKTVGQSSDQYIETATDANMIRLRDELKKDAETYEHRLIGYLKDNCDLFPEYKNFICNFENIKPEQDQTPDLPISFL